MGSVELHNIRPTTDLHKENSSLIEHNTTIDVDCDFTEKVEEFSSFFSPIRFSIMIELFQSNEVMSSKLREALGVSWGRFLSAINCLEDNNMLIYHTRFHNGMKKRFVSISHNGLKKFKVFRRFLLKSIHGLKA